MAQAIFAAAIFLAFFNYRLIKRLVVGIMVGTLVEVGLGKRSPDGIALLFEELDRGAAGMTAPAHGLCLMEVFY